MDIFPNKLPPSHRQKLSLFHLSPPFSIKYSVIAHCFCQTHAEWTITIHTTYSKISRFIHHLFNSALLIYIFNEVGPNLIYLITEVKKNPQKFGKELKPWVGLLNTGFTEELIFLLKCEYFKPLVAPKPANIIHVTQKYNSKLDYF